MNKLAQMEGDRGAAAAAIFPSAPSAATRRAKFNGARRVRACVLASECNTVRPAIIPHLML